MARDKPSKPLNDHADIPGESKSNDPWTESGSTTEIPQRDWTIEALRDTGWSGYLTLISGASRGGFEITLAAGTQCLGWHQLWTGPPAKGPTVTRSWSDPPVDRFAVMDMPHLKQEGPVHASNNRLELQQIPRRDCHV